MKKTVIAVVVAAVMSATASATVVAKRLYRANPGDRVYVSTAALRCTVGYAQISCVDPRPRSKHLTVLFTREELSIARPVKTRKGRQTRVIFRSIR